MVPEYRIARSVGLTLWVPFFLISSLQLINIWHSKTTASISLWEAKHGIHYSMWYLALLTIVTFVDVDGQFGLISFTAQVYIQELSSRALGVAWCFCIYSHFHAHYLACRKDIPPMFKNIFAISLCVWSAITVLGQILAYNLNQNGWNALTSCFDLIFIITVQSTDLYGYYLVRSLLLEIIHTETIKNSSIYHQVSQSPSSSITSSDPLAPSSPSSTPRRLQETHEDQTKEQNDNNSSTQENITIKRKETNNNDFTYYRELIQKMRNFHFACVILSIIYSIDAIRIIMDGLDEPTRVPSYPSPDSFSDDSSAIYGFIFCIQWSVLTWWGWIPFYFLEKNTDKELTMVSNTEMT